MITVAEARIRAADRLTRNLPSWATAEDDRIAVAIALKPPTEREMLANERAAEAWARAWAAVPDTEGFTVERETRTWRSIGRQVVPVRMVLTSARALAAFVGGAARQDYERLARLTVSAVAQLGRNLEGQPGDAASAAVRAALRLHARRLLELDDAEVARLLGAVAWLADNDVAGLRPRQVPVRGVDSKWFEKYRTLVTALHAAVRDGRPLEIVNADTLIRVRILDPALAPGGVADLAAPAQQLAALDLRPRTVLLVENRETLLALPAWPGVVAIHSQGYAIDLLDGIGWVGRTPVVYWGDLDSHGFAILHRLRTHHPDVTTVLMDEGTLADHLDLAVPEPRPARGTFPTLTEAEAAALERLRTEGDLRLEQERIPWAYALTKLSFALR